MLSHLSNILFKQNIPRNILKIQQNYINNNANDLWKSVLSVSNQGSKKGRGKRRGGGSSKNLNIGQQLGDGKMQIKWPGLNTNIMENRAVKSFEIVGEDVDREKRLTELRNRMDKFKKISVAPHERGFTGSSLEGKSIGPPKEYDDVNFDGFDTRIIEYKTMLSHKSILGKKKVCGCFVITGNRNGIIGYGKGKSSNSGGAVNLAKLHASTRLLYINRYEDRTLFHNFYEEYYFTKIYAEKRPKGFGLVCHRVIKKICELIGIKDLYCKVEGSRNHKNITKAFLSGLVNQNKYAEIAEKKGLHVVEFKPEMRNFPTVLASPKTDSLDDQLLSEIRMETDLNLFLFGNKYRLKKDKKLPFYGKYESYKHYCKLRDRDAAQKKARIERLRLVENNKLMSSQYPLKPKPKQKETDQE